MGDVLLTDDSQIYLCRALSGSTAYPEIYVDNDSISCPSCHSEATEIVRVVFVLAVLCGMFKLQRVGFETTTVFSIDSTYVAYGGLSSLLVAKAASLAHPI